MDVASRHIDVYLTWGEPPAQVKEKIKRMKEKAKQTGREIRFGIRLHVIVRETEEEAWKAADELIQHVDEEAVKSTQKYFLEWIQKVKNV